MIKTNSKYIRNVMDICDEWQNIPLKFGQHYMYMYCTPDFTVWHGVLFIRQGMYQEGIFRFILTIPENFPDGDCPVSHLLSKSLIKNKFSYIYWLKKNMMKLNKFILKDGSLEHIFCTTLEQIFDFDFILLSESSLFIPSLSPFSGFHNWRTWCQESFP